MTKQEHFLPDWIYEAIPYVYFIIGLAVILVLRNNWAFFSGIAWMLAGMAVLTMRLKHRKALSRPGATDAVHATGNRTLQIQRLDSGSIGLVWSKAYECGNTTIDQQHRSLFEKGNALLDAFSNKRKQHDLESSFDTLLHDIKKHFATEEEMLEVFDHPQARAHKQVHDDLLAKATTLRQMARDRKLTVGDLLGFIVNDLVLEHMTKDDRKFFHQV
jgi:hemerythrin-like metal-binding protein